MIPELRKVDPPKPEPQGRTDPLQREISREEFEKVIDLYHATYIEIGGVEGQRAAITAILKKLGIKVKE